MESKIKSSDEKQLEFLQAQLGGVNEILAGLCENSITSKITMTSRKEMLEEEIESLKQVLNK